MSISDFLTQGNPPSTLLNPVQSISGYPDWLQQAQQQDILQASQIAGASDPIYQGQQLANFNNQQNQAFGLASQDVGAVQPYMQQGLNTLGTLGQGFNQQQYSQYANPYIQGANNAIANAGTQNLLQNTLPAAASQFIANGQFGSQQQGNTTAQLTNAEQQNVMNTQATTDLAAQQAAMQSYLQGQQLSGTAAQNQIAGANTLQGANTTDINNLLAAGNQQQNLNQQGLNVDYSNFEQQANYPLQQLAIMQSAIQGTSVPTQQTMYMPSLFNSSTSPSSGASALAYGGSLLSGISALAKGGQFKPRYDNGGVIDPATALTSPNTPASAISDILKQVAAMKEAGAVPPQQPHILKANQPQRPGLGDMFMPVEGQERPSWYDTTPPQQQQAQNQANAQIQQALNQNSNAQSDSFIQKLLSSNYPAQAKGGLTKVRYDDGGPVSVPMPPAQLQTAIANLAPQGAPTQNPATTGSTPSSDAVAASLTQLAKQAGVPPMPPAPSVPQDSAPQMSAPMASTGNGDIDNLMAQKMRMGMGATQQLIDASQGAPQLVKQAQAARMSAADQEQQAIKDYIAKATQNNPNLDTYNGINNPLLVRGLMQGIAGTTGDNAGYGRILNGLAGSGIEGQQQSQDFADKVKNLMILAANAKENAAVENANESTGLAEKAATAANTGGFQGVGQRVILTGLLGQAQQDLDAAKASGNPAAIQAAQNKVDALSVGIGLKGTEVGSEDKSKQYVDMGKSLSGQLQPLATLSNNLAPVANLFTPDKIGSQNMITPLRAINEATLNSLQKSALAQLKGLNVAEVQSQLQSAGGLNPESLKLADQLNGVTKFDELPPKTLIDIANQSQLNYAIAQAKVGLFNKMSDYAQSTRYKDDPSVAQATLSQMDIPIRDDSGKYIDPNAIQQKYNDISKNLKGVSYTPPMVQSKPIVTTPTSSPVPQTSIDKIKAAIKNQNPNAVTSQEQ